MRRAQSVHAVKEKSKRGAKVAKDLAFKHRRKRTGISTYRRVAAVFRRRISTGEWQAGDRLPALDALVKELHVGRIKDYPDPVALTDLLIERRLYRELENEAPSNRPMLERLAAHHADLSQIQQTFTIGEADIELARRLRLQESSPTAELRRIARDSSGTIIYFGFLFFPGHLVRLDFKVDLHEARPGQALAAIGKPAT